MQTKFKIKELVRLATGGPAMTVETFTTRSSESLGDYLKRRNGGIKENVYYFCKWTEDGMQKSGEFAEKSLEFILTDREDETGLIF